MEELYNKNKGLLYYLARRYKTACEIDRATDIEDLTQAGFLGLVEAARTFDGVRGMSWGSWAAWYVKKEMCKALGRRGTRKRAEHYACSLDKPISEDVDGSMMELLADPNLPESDEALILEDTRKTILEAVERLDNEKEREAVRRVDLEEMTQEEAAKSLGLSNQRISQLHKQALKKLKKDSRLRVLVDVNEMTRFNAHKGVKAFQSDHTSVVEAAVMWRLDQNSLESQIARFEAHLKRSKERFEREFVAE